MEHRASPDIRHASKEEVIRLHPDARVELRAAWLWYAEVSDRIATRFQAEIDASVAAKAEGPDR